MWRITLQLHVLSEAKGTVIGADRTWDAIRLSAWYLGRQIRLLPGSSAKCDSANKLSKNAVLQKIRTKAPVSDHQLLRSFHRATKAQLAPVVTELRHDGLVRRDENGKLVVAERTNGRV